jgi:uncharacterized protein
VKGFNPEEATLFLRASGAQENVVEHCLTVSKLALEMGERIKAAGHTIDVGFVEAAAILHDIGRAKTHGILHGIEGAKMLADYPAYARVCKTHIGGGITSEEAAALGLPAGDFLPETLEEKVVCLADKLVSGTRKTTLEEALGKYAERLGPRHPTIDRIRRLDEEIRGLMGGS